MIKKLVPRSVKDFLRVQRQCAAIRRDPVLHSLTVGTAPFTPLEDRAHIDLILSWFAWAQDQHADGGIPSLIDLQRYAREGRAVAGPSYPETSGYILCSLMMGARHGLPSFERARLDRLVQYLISVQRADGSIPPTVDISRGLAFDTGQVLTGLVAYHRYIEPRENVRTAIVKAADWMSANIDADGKYVEAACYNGARAYYVQATIGLIEAAMAFGREDWRAAAARNAGWTYGLRAGDAWLRRFSFEDDGFQNLHGIAYTLRGLIDLGRHLDKPEYVAFARACVDRMMEEAHDDLPVAGAIAGYYADGFRRHRTVLSPTGMCQMALCAYLLAQYTSEARYTAFGDRLIESVKQLHLRGYTDAGLNGLLTGSWPVTGPYMRGMLPNWPIKFFLDALYVRQGVNAFELQG